MSEMLGNRVRAARGASGLSQRALAARAGVGQNLIVRVEKGEDVRLSTLERIARAAGLEIRLVPRHVAPAVEAVVRAHEQGKDLATKMKEPMHQIEDVEEDMR